MTGLETIGLIAGLAGTGLSAIGAVSQGIQQNEAMKAQADAQEREAVEQRAASQREAIQRAKEARFVLSRQQTVAAASGGGATDPTVLDLMGEVAAAGEYNAASSLYEGEAAGRGLEDQAAISRWRGRQEQLGGFVNAGSTMLSGASNFASGWSDMRRKQFPSAPPQFYPGIS